MPKASKHAAEETPLSREIALHCSALTVRETDVYLFAIFGGSIRDAAKALRAPETSVKNRLKSVYAKLGVKTKAELQGRLLSLAITRHEAKAAAEAFRAMA